MGTMAGMSRKYAMKLVTMNLGRQLRQVRKAASMASIWPSWSMSMSLTWMKATIMVGIAAKMTAERPRPGAAACRCDLAPLFAEDGEDQARLHGCLLVAVGPLPHQVEVDLLEAGHVLTDGQNAGSALHQLADQVRRVALGIGQLDPQVAFTRTDGADERQPTDGPGHGGRSIGPPSSSISGRRRPHAAPQLGWGPFRQEVAVHDPDPVAQSLGLVEAVHTRIDRPASRSPAMSSRMDFAASGSSPLVGSSR